MIGGGGGGGRRRDGGRAYLWYHVEPSRESCHRFSGQGTASSQECYLRQRVAVVPLQDQGVNQLPCCFRGVTLGVKT